MKSRFFSRRGPRSSGVRPRAALVTLVLAGALALSGCGDSSSDSGDGGGDDSFSVKHRFGSTKVEIRDGQRVVSLAPPWTDALLAVDEQPTAVAADPVSQGKPFPWQKGKLATGDKAPEQVKLVGGYTIPIERVASLKPDLILGGALITDKKIYGKLSRIAPTIPAFSADGFVDRWQDQVKLVGRALEKGDEAKAAVKKSESAVSSWRAEHPGLKGQTYAFGLGSGPTDIQVVSDPKDAAAQFFSGLGLEMAPKVVGLKGGTSGVQGSISMERIDLMNDADVLIMGFLAPDMKTEFERSPLVKDLRPVKQGTYQAADVNVSYALRQPSALTGPWLLGELEPVLQKASDNPPKEREKQ